MSIFDNSSGLRSISCLATTTNRVNATANQDSYASAENRRLALKALIVADGLGSFEYAELASQVVTQQVKVSLEEMRSAKELDFHKLFKEAKAELIRFAERFEQEKGLTINRDQSFGTTLIVAVEEARCFRIAYVGNGAIWHIRGNFNQFHHTKYLPWNALNYLNPHSVQNEMGKEAVYRLISCSHAQEECLPTILHIEKDDESYGDLLMICTDGIYSYDQVPIGKLKDGSVWISGEATMPLFFQTLREYFEQSAVYSEHALQHVIQTYLETLKQQGMLDDDATLGVLITQKALEYQRKR